MIKKADIVYNSYGQMLDVYLPEGKINAVFLYIHGGGIAGVAAAVAASRGGAKTLLLEKGINLGGLATGGLISWYEPLCDTIKSVVASVGECKISDICERIIAAKNKVNSLS